MVNLLDPAEQLIVEEQDQQHAVTALLDGHELGIYKLDWSALFRKRSRDTQ
jgi:hypothetical protein